MGAALGWEHTSSGGQARQGQHSRVGGAFVPSQERVARPLNELAPRLLSQFLGLVDVYLPEVTEVLWAGIIAMLGGGVVIELERGLGGFQFGGQHDVGYALFSRPHQRVATDDAGQPDLRVRLLEGSRPWVDVTVLVMLALPAEGAGGGPGLDDELVGLLEPLPVVGRRRVVGHALPTGSPHPAGDQSTAGDHVDHRELFHQPERIVPDGDDVPQQHDLGPLGDAGEDGRLDVHGAAHAEGRAVVLIEHQAVKAHFLGV